MSFEDMNMHGMRDECLAALLLMLSSVIVSGAGELQISHEALTKRKNETFFVLCRDSGGSPVTWRGPKGVLGPKTKPTVQVASYGTTLVFNGATLEESGTYTCSTDNEHKEFHLTITEPLTFMDTDSTQTGEEGKPFTLRCEVQGGKVTWLVEGGEVPGTEKYVVGGDGLFIKKLERTDAKTYICKAVQQSTGDVEDRRIKLRVLHKPSFPHPTYAKQEVAWAYVNGTVNLTCEAVANPPAKFVWMKNNDQTQKIGTVINESEDVSVLQLHVDKNTFGNYKCIASNQYGDLEKHFSLEEGFKPKPPELLELRTAGSDWLDVEIRALNSSAADQEQEMKPVSVNVLYKKTGESQWQSRDFNITKDDIYRVDNLTSNTKYEIKAATRNPAGVSDHSNILLLETLPPPPPDSSPATAFPCSTAVAAVFLATLLHLVFW